MHQKVSTSNLEFYCKMYVDEIKCSLPVAVLFDFFFFLNCTVSCIFVVYYVILQCTHPVAHSISFKGRFFLCINLNWYLRHSSFGLRAFANVQKNAIRKLIIFLNLNLMNCHIHRPLSQHENSPSQSLC